MAFARKDRNISMGVFLMFFLGFFLIGFILYIVAENQKYFEAKYSVFMHLPNAEGLKSGAYVALSGIKIGVVGKLKIDDELENLGITIELKIEEAYAKYITSSSVAMIKTMGILGDKYVDVTIGKPGEAVLQPGDIIKSNPGIDPYEFLDDASAMINDLKTTLNNIGTITSEAKEGRGVVGKLFKDPVSEAKFDRLLTNVTAISDGLAKGKGSAGRLLQDTTLYVSLTKSSDNFQAVMDSIHNGKGTFGQMLADTAFYPRLKAISVKTDSLLYHMQHGGTVAQLLKDKQLYENLVNLTRSLDSLSTDLKKNPGRYVQVKVF